MKNCYKILLIFSVTLSFCTLAIAESNLKIAVDDDFPPFSFIANDEKTGIDIDIIHELGRRLNINFEISLVPWKRLLIMTEKGEYDGSMSLFKTKEREQYAIFTHPIHYSTFVLFVKKGNEFNYTSVEDLYGKRILKQAGFSIGGEFGKAEKEKKILVQDAFEFKEFLMSVVNGRADGFISNKEVTLYKLKYDNDFKTYAEKITYLPKPLENKRGAYLVLSKKARINNKFQLAQKITSALIEMEKDGTTFKISSKYVVY